MPIHKISGLTVNVCGDVHLGRTFRTGVPLHRLGDREEMVWEDFEQQLNVEADLTIIMGDLFDKFVVPPEVVLRVYGLLARYASVGQPIYILRGNHDASRDSQKASSLDLLKALLEGGDAHGTPAVTVVETRQFCGPKGRLLLLCGWSPFLSAADTVSGADSNAVGRITAAFGHWDVTQHGQDDHNLIPLQQLAELGVKRVFTGHVHKADSFTRNGIEVTVVGSMQPYAHGEEPEGSALYMTMMPAEADICLNSNEAAFCSTNVRILLADGEEYTREFDCLSKTFKRVPKIDADTGEPVQAGYDTFDLKTMITTTLSEFGVSETLSARINSKLLEKMNHA